MKNSSPSGHPDHPVFLSKCVIAFIVLMPLAALSQNRKIDSLKLLLSDDSNSRFNDVLHDISVEFMLAAEYDSAHRYIARLYSIGKRNGDSLDIVRGTAIKGSIFRRSGQLDSAMHLYNKVLPIARRREYWDQCKNILNSLGNLYTIEARYDAALKCHFESLEIRERQGDKFDISVALTNIGVAYYKISNPDRALVYYMRALRLKKDIKNLFELDVLLLNIALSHNANKEFEIARKFVDEAFSVCKDSCSDYFLTSAFLGLGVIALDEGNLIESEKYLLKSHSLARQNNDVRFQFDNISLLTSIYITRNQVTLAENYLKDAEVLTQLDGRYRKELADIYFQFANLYGKSANLKRKIYFQDKYIALRDSIFNEEVTANLMKAESDYLERENKAKIEAQNKIVTLSNEIIFRQRIVNVCIGVIAVCGILLAILFARRNKARQIINRILDERVKERTIELEVNRDALERAWQERDLVIHKASSDIQSSLATIKGLCFLGQKEVDRTKLQDYWLKLSTTSEKLSSTLDRMSFPKKDDLRGDESLYDTMIEIH